MTSGHQILTSAAIPSPHRRVRLVIAAAQLLSALRAGRLRAASLARTVPVASLRWPFLPR